MYMYVHELMSNESRRKATSSVFIREVYYSRQILYTLVLLLLLLLLLLLQCCVVGVCHLGLLLSARVPLDPQEDYSANDDTLAQLLQEGIATSSSRTPAKSVDNQNFPISSLGSCFCEFVFCCVCRYLQ